MNDLVRIPCVLMRGGTSRGPYFLASDLPRSAAQRDRFLLAAMGSGHVLEIDGIGGGNPLTSKVAIVSPSKEPGADVDYLFAQVKVLERVVDTSPNCGNMLAGVGPFAIEAGLIPARRGVTPVRIYNVNTRKLIEARIATPNGSVVYDGDAAIDGVPGTAAPVHLAFLGAAGSKTGKLLPTGSAVDVIDGIDVSCVDAAMPVVIFRAADFGKTGHEAANELSADRAFMARLEKIRIEAGQRMGFPDAADRVIPKPVLIAPPARGGTLAARYFMPHECHGALAITGSVAIATAVATPRTLPAELVGRVQLPADLAFEHPSGRLDVRLESHPDYAEPAAFVVRTARRLFEGYVLVKRSVLGAAADEQANPAVAHQQDEEEVV
jgi:2-methylaconitate cis-trans-isomerase PrpF